MLNRLVPIALALVACDPRSSVTFESSDNDPWASHAVRSHGDTFDLTSNHRRAEQACPLVTQPELYRVEKDGARSYLLGTRHVGVSLAKFPSAVRQHIRDSKLAVFEVAPDDHDSGNFHDGSTDLRAALGDKDWNRYRELVGDKIARKMEDADPAEAGIIMSLLFEDPSAMLDRELEKQVARDGVPARGLETAAFQIDLLHDIFDLRMLRAMIEQTSSRQELLDDATHDLRSYCDGTDTQAGTSDKTRKELRAAGYSDAEIDAMDDRLVFARNAKWIPELEPILDGGGAFVAVGAAHLRGPKGVVALLRAQGYTVVRVTTG